MKILLTGASGFAGWHLARALAPVGRLTGTYRGHSVEHPDVEMVRLDLGDEAGIRGLLARLRPDAVVHTAAMSKTGHCERDPEGAVRDNVHGTRRLSEALDEICPDAHLVHFSTDLVYAGTRPHWHEEDRPAPVMHYGKTKLAAEEIVAARPGASTILRAALMYGPATPWAGGATSWIVDALRGDEPLTLYRDEFRSPVYIADVIATVECALRHPVGLGVINCGGSSRVSRVEMGETIADALGSPRALIREHSLAEAELDAPRAADVSMDTTRLSTLLGRAPTSFEAGFRSTLERG